MATLKYLLLPAFLLMVAAQLYFPANVIMQKEKILHDGTEYRFRIFPVLSHITGQGDGIHLAYTDNTIPIENASSWYTGEPIYITLKKDSLGFATISQVSKEKPSGEEDFVNGFVEYSQEDTTDRLFIRYPFDWYIPDEPLSGNSMPYDPRLDTMVMTTSAVVMVQAGDAVVKDVYINEWPLDVFIKEEKYKE